MPRRGPFGDRCNLEHERELLDLSEQDFHALEFDRRESGREAVTS